MAGPDDPLLGVYFYIQRLVEGGPLILKNGGIQIVHFAYSRDLARAYVATLTSPQAANQIYHFAQREATRLLDWLHIAARLLEVQSEFVSIPAEVIDTSGFWYPEPELMVQHHVLDTSKIERDLGCTFTPLDKWIAETVRWWRNGYQGPDSPGYGQRPQEIAFARAYQEAVAALRVS